MENERLPFQANIVNVLHCATYKWNNAEQTNSYMHHYNVNQLKLVKINLKSRILWSTHNISDRRHRRRWWRRRVARSWTERKHCMDGNVEGGSWNERGRHRLIRRERERTHTNMTKKREKLNSKTWRKQKHEHYINGCDCVDNDDNTVENHKICYVSNRWWMVKAMHITRYSLTISATHATQGTKIRFLSLFELTRWSFVSSTLCWIELCATTVPKSTDYQQPKMWMILSVILIKYHVIGAMTVIIRQYRNTKYCQILKTCMQWSSFKNIPHSVNI